MAGAPRRRLTRAPGRTMRRTAPTWARSVQWLWWSFVPPVSRLMPRAMVAHGRQWDRAGPSTSRPNRFSTVPHDDVLWEVALLDQEIPRSAVFPRHSRHLNPADRKAVAQQNPGPLGQKTQWHGTH